MSNYNWSQFTRANIKKFINGSIESVKCNINNIVNDINKIVIDKNIKIEETNINKNKIKDFANTFWVDKELINNIEELKEEYFIKTNDIDFYIKTKDNYIKYIKTYLPEIIRINNYLKSLSDNKNKPIVYLVLSELKKEFNDNEIIGVPSVNTGYTDTNTGEIFIWRYEEWTKVLFHELIHFYNLDNRNVKVNKEFPFKIQGLKSYFEAWTDMMAIVLNTIFIKNITNLPIKKLFTIELTFVENQAKAMYYALGMDKNKVKQTTSAFSYYVLKYWLFESCDDFNLNKDFNDMLDKIKVKELDKNYIELKSSRMTLLQLK
jgi:hypothetical protein